MEIRVRDIYAVPDYPRAESVVDLEAILPLSLIREHTKTDDIPSVTDAQLLLYRRAAFEACQLYTGLNFTSSRVIREQIASEHKTRFRRVRKHKLKHATTDGNIYFYGGGLLQPVLVRVPPGEREVVIPILQEALDASSCCRPCSTGGENFGISIMYMSGVESCDSIPAACLLGCLKFIAWSITNPGSVIMTVKNRTGAGETGIVGTNNGAWASGAIEEWRQLTVESF